jgi:dsRNA-specific ribonuclease
MHKCDGKWNSIEPVRWIFKEQGPMTECKGTKYNMDSRTEAQEFEFGLVLGRDEMCKKLGDAFRAVLGAVVEAQTWRLTWQFMSKCLVKQ